MELKWTNNNLKAGDYIDYAVEFYRQNIKSIFKLLIIFHIPVTFVLMLLMDPSGFLDLIADTLDAQALLTQVIKLYSGLILYSIYSAIFFNVIIISVVYYTYQKIVFNKDLSFKECIKRGFKRFGFVLLWNLLFSTVLSSICGVAYSGVFIAASVLIAVNSTVTIVIAIILIVLASIAVILFFLYAYIRTAFVPVCIATKSVNMTGAYKMSLKLTKEKKKFWNMAWTYVLAFLLVSAVPSVLSALNSLILINTPVVGNLMYAVISSIGALITPIQYVVYTFIYIKREKEQGDLDFVYDVDTLLDKKEKELFRSEQQDTQSV